MSQLKMHFSAAKIAANPAPVVPAGFALRTYIPVQDDENYIALMRNAGFKYWDGEFLKRTVTNMYPDGLFFLVDTGTGRLAATAVANRTCVPGFPDGCEFGWLAADPAFQGRGLSRVVHDAVIQRFRQADVQNVYLSTDDHRIPAIKLYLGKGWEPVIVDDDARMRWEAIRNMLAKPAKQVSQEYGDRC